MTILSPEAAASFIGVAAWRALVSRAGAGVGEDILDCGDSAGYTLEALHAGQQRLIFSGNPEQRRSLFCIAERAGARILPGRPDAMRFSLLSSEPLMLVRTLEERYL
ncbi:hypothetical protein LOC54_01460 [Acetobacter sp. AN02]|uniref:hypothetical protein n=1 Tax=Acetobacter sp. AN02 TaxID=2894186 RepID=UPI0024342883|nr:hypothetical protein [Acetobacter sp. AN02]MDG6093789.1 hypothetical protein [Acetobacter sp. AN02]